MNASPQPRLKTWIHGITWASAALLLAPSSANAWGRQGHATIALVAQGRLSPRAKLLVDELRRAPGWQNLMPGNSRYFRDADKELARFCQGPNGDLSLAADWADAWRESHRSTARLHFVDTPLAGAGTRADLAAACGEDCILTELNREIRILGDHRAARLRRLEALLWVVHLVGDIHQPLHCSDNSDRGGNAVRVRVLGRGENLHYAWDSGFFFVEHVRPRTLAAELLAQDCQRVPPAGAISVASPWLWARESFGIAKNFVYPQEEQIQGRFNRTEVERAWPILRLQLARAGVRLAATLNQAAR